jgi:hypothetical protein
MYLGRADMLCPPTVSRFVPMRDIAHMIAISQTAH